MFNPSNQGTGLFGSQPNNVQPQQPQLGSSLLSGTQPQTRSLFTQPSQQLGGNVSGASNTQPNQSGIFGGSTLVGGSSSILYKPLCLSIMTLQTTANLWTKVRAHLTQSKANFYSNNCRNSYTIPYLQPA